MIDLPGIVVNETFVRDHRDELVLCDVRWYLDGRSALDAYASSHLPGALFVDLDRNLSGEPGGAAGRHPFPSPDAFAERLGALGVGDDAVVIAYDDSGGGTAGRMVWMLRAIGQRAGLLDGGIDGWKGALESGPPTPRPAIARTPVPWPASIENTADEMLQRIATSVLLDARAGERFRGEVEPTAAPPGHIPRARSLPWTDLIDPVTKYFLPPDQVRQRFAKVGVDANEQFIASCGSGVSACALLVGGVHAGLIPGELFVPSMSGWSAEGREVVTE
ncbi:MAG TPA: sulfurtransferase [Acidimicrobiales bacterium]|jgi:thiosulfate/3-mercaptopyruvate sulfurtransferase|nr:sulfurtransferase [Acidimicrobiales bacterium]